MSNIQAFTTTEPIQVDRAVSFVTSSSYGATNLFTGTVRNSHNNRQVEGITYDGHRVLADKTLQSIAAEAHDKWPEISIYLSHFIGRLGVGEISVIIAIGSPHREPSFAACRFIIEQLKMRAPIWKQEHYVDGSSDWLPGHSLNK
ncbi:molybdenum cofactor biosynthesis protein MoaE [Halorhodospira halochloris]|uniref:Molybdopterin synthase catalytic subunit n=1 Tax=Halorhodospira halochloris TaxID=1052 RepID=A0A110B4C8_HALHR|nr:molybdenum cofactor biosynthesis protein MoaE [Halorhodospira halochloris]MBK1652457.1 hypothetical protein [Halorhodospira halochloris]MCG5547468.1 molybdenum cofactor biosynthesis protein MoaE [Halorhodospira halochloris]BAU56352.1 molybdenum cofactor biosynthesis protein MoaE [Halorhodospira halochloris]